MDALVCEERDLVFDPGGNRKPVQRVEDGGDVLVFAYSHQDPSSGVLNVLELLQVAARDPDEECVAIVQSGGDKGMDQLLGIREGESGAEFGDVPKVVEGGLADMVNVRFEGELGVHFDAEICNCR